MFQQECWTEIRRCLKPEEVGCMFFRNIGTHLTIYAA